MTEDGEKKMLELLTTINKRLTHIEADAKWLRDREQQKADNIGKMGDDVRSMMPRKPK